MNNPDDIDDLSREKPFNYVLITPARNEAEFIELTIKSMVVQTRRPIKWVIVSDGSTDRTDEIVKGYLQEHPWIVLIRMQEREDRHFAGKVLAFKAGYKEVRDLDFDVIGNLDADVSFDPEHFAFLIGQMERNPRLGVTGAPFREGTFQYDYRFTNIENVWGGCQLFRRSCYESIGGYMPLKGGCIDHVAVLSARMCGWETRTFPDKICIHHRQMGTALHGGLRAKVRTGAKDYSVGNHPVWQLFRALYQITKPPYGIGGLAVGWGYFWAFAQHREIVISKELVTFVRREQMQRLAGIFRGKRHPLVRST
jgi:poly-beta-1,6-N-acetyl-D-glucosamine synthase